VQSNIMVGNLTFLPADPRTYSAAVTNQILGGGASSRLFLILREAKSWTYGAYSRFARRKGLGSFQARTEVRTEVTDSALKEMLVQLRRITTEPVPTQELEDAKGSLTGSFPLSIESADQVAGAVANARLYGLAPDYVQTYRVRIGAVTAAQVQSTAQATIRPNAAAIVVVGDGAKVYESLKGIAPVTIVDPRATPSLRRISRPRSRRWISISQRWCPAATVSASACRETSSAGSAVCSRRPPTGFGTPKTPASHIRQPDDCAGDGCHGPNEEREPDRQGAGQDAKVDVVYAGGRAKGTASTPDPQTRAIKQVTIDTLVADGTVDDNAVQALLPALKWKAGAKWTINVLSAGQAEIKPWTLTVAATEPVTIGGKPVEAYRTELVGPPSRSPSG
jgi:hypothetical protein